MSPVTEAPDLSDYHQIHRAIRASARQLGAAVRDLTATDRRRAEALAWWYDGFAAELHYHHVVEDEIFFPALAERIPTYSDHSDELAVDHETLEAMLPQLSAALHQLARGEQWDVAREQAVVLADQLHSHLDEHLGVEDDDVLPLFERHFTKAEYEALVDRAMKAGKMSQLAFTIPWLVSTLEPDEFTELFETAPRMLKLLWRATRGRYARRASLALGVTVVAVPA